jgi:uncharacterized protein
MQIFQILLLKKSKMSGEKNLQILLKNMQPVLNEGDFVFCTINDFSKIYPNDVILFFKETEGITIVLSKNKADLLNLEYSFVASWITLTVHSALDAVGLTAAFSTELAKEGISCNVIAAYYHDHIFVEKKDETNAMLVLKSL